VSFITTIYSCNFDASFDNPFLFLSMFHSLKCLLIVASFFSDPI
jgi:hypothetical protein